MMLKLKNAITVFNGMGSYRQGRLTLVISDYFEFGVQAMREVSSCLTFENLENDLDVAVSTRNNVLKKNELLREFHATSIS